ncbi:MAG TPA: SpoIIE family protein phosphatase [Trebonia sp.]|nr:SpoIIE family protein phosphatase [Trebonia sp.]
MDTPELSVRELEALFEQSPVAMIFTDRDLRNRRANAAFRRLARVSDDTVIGRRPSETEGADWLLDTEYIERTLAEQVIGKGIPIVNMPLERTEAGKRRVISWTAYRVTDNDQVLGVVGTLLDITEEAEAEAALRQANARFDLLQRAGSEIGTTLDVYRTAEELVTLAVPEIADRTAVELLEPVLLGEDPSPSPRELRFRRLAVRDAATPGTGNFAVGEPFVIPMSRSSAGLFLRGELLVARNRAEMRQLDLPSYIVQPLLDRDVHTLITVSLRARGVTLGLANFSRSKTPEPYDEADVRLITDLAARAAVHIDNARLYTREHEAAVTLQRSLLPRDLPQVAGLEVSYRFQPASRAAEIGGDWFDVIPHDRGSVTLVVGDVGGHGIQAAATMGQLRTTTDALTHLGCPPEQILRQLSRMVATHGMEAGATCLHAVYDPRTQRCQLTSAGHPPPALRHPDGRTELIDLPPGLLLGAGQIPYAATEIALPPGSILAMYTDGLIERPGEDIGIGMSRLSRALADGPAGSLDDLCAAVLTSLDPDPRDDVALLLARTITGQNGD